ncbi:MAG: hypothetical protein BWY72_02305 [Bacteroidetes bacterium ADurb.Bin416]|nr:MAG: hypothetical protein BWY72_02305 [Bacteroidetes bacterium ADurb.Bin416]
MSTGCETVRMDLEVMLTTALTVFSAAMVKSVSRPDGALILTNLTGC